MPIIESKEFKGYFVPHGNSDVVISRGYVVINCRTGNILSNVLRNHGYWSVNVKRRVNGNQIERQYLIHRMYALAFIEIPAELAHLPLSKIQVNHKDGDKLNNAEDNLEWVRAKKNMRHAFETKLIDIGIEVCAKHVITGDVTTFPTVIACALNFDMSRQKLHRHLLSPHEGMITKEWHVFKRKDERPWPELSVVDRVKSKWDYTAVVVARNTDGNSLIFNSIKEACGVIGLSYDAVKNRRRSSFNKGLPDEPYLGWQFEEYDSVVGVDVKGLEPFVKKKRYKDKTYLVKNTLTGIQSEIIGMKALSGFIDYSVGRIADCLRNKQFNIGDYEVIVVPRMK